MYDPIEGTPVEQLSERLEYHKKEYSRQRDRFVKNIKENALWDLTWKFAEQNMIDNLKLIWDYTAAIDILKSNQMDTFTERLYSNFKKLLDDYYKLLKSKSSLSMEKLTDKERLAKLEEAKKLIDEGNAGLNKQGLLVDMRIKGNENAVKIPKH